MDNSLLERLSERKQAGNFRSLGKTEGLLDFVSNDYLGLARNETLFQLIKMRMDESTIPNKNGSGGSRLLSGNSSVYERVEAYLADIFESEATLIFNSGYQANLALVSAVPQKGDTIIYDQLSHICLKEGAWLSKADSVMFAHNDLEDLERKLRLAKGERFVVIEAIYSMDGDYAPLEEMISLAQRYDTKIILDEAHSTGVHGKRGSGWAVQQKYQEAIFARVYTFGKAMGVHGACIAGSNVLKDYLINFARPFIYTTALPLHSLVSIEESFRYLENHQYLQDELHELIIHFQTEMSQLFTEDHFFQLMSKTAIQPIVLPGNDKIKKISKGLQDKGFDVRPILSPTVQKGAERLRISLHVHNKKREITEMLNSLKELV